MSGPNLLQWLLLISCYNIVTLFFQVEANSSISNNENTGIQFEMLHMHSPQLKRHSKFLGPPKCKAEGMSQLLGRDIARRQMISTVGHSTRRKALVVNQNQTARFSLYSGSDSGQGQYFVSIRVGTPNPQEMILVTDTGSDLTWMNCQYNKSQLQSRKSFHAKNSSSFMKIPCSSRYCKVDLQSFFSLKECTTPDSPCRFDYRYFNGQRALGLFGNETITVGLNTQKEVKVSDVLIGCTESFDETSAGFPDGVMGLGYSNYSLSLRVAKMFNNKFSYCLVDHLSSSTDKSFLSFGESKEKKTIKMQYTKLFLGYIQTFYSVNVSGISVGGRMLNISPAIWDVAGEGGMIVDSGTSLTMLAGEAYDKVVEAFKPVFTKYKKVVPEGLPGLDEFCFEDKGFDNSTVPKLQIHFADGAIFEPPVKSYIIDVADGIKCLGITRVDFPGISIFGNIMQQNHFWEFDLGRRRLGFGPSSCIMSN